jgi:hypothetical protein
MLIFFSEVMSYFYYYLTLRHPFFKTKDFHRWCYQNIKWTPFTYFFDSYYEYVLKNENWIQGGPTKYLETTDISKKCPNRSILISRETRDRIVTNLAVQLHSPGQGGYPLINHYRKQKWGHTSFWSNLNTRYNNTMILLLLIQVSPKKKTSP